MLEEGCVFLFDVDNTLFDNDRFGADLGDRLAAAFGASERERYWALYAQLRDQLGYADYLSALQRFRAGLEDHAQLLEMSAFMLDYPFAGHLFPQALQVLEKFGRSGRTAILSDGDVVFQPRKIQRAGIWDAVQGRVLIYVHKERALQAMQSRLPARHYVMVDDKPGILAAMKRIMGKKLTTIFVRQGHYATLTAGASVEPLPDRTIETIGALLELNPDTLKVEP